MSARAPWPRVTGLVLLHGFTGGPESFDPVVDRLRDRLGGLPVWRPALLGHRGAAPSAARRFEHEVDRLAGELRHRGLVGAHLAGYSQGARVALGLLARHGFLFAGATLIGVHPGLGSREDAGRRRLADERWCRLLEGRSARDFADAWEAQPLFATQRRLPTASRSRQRALRLAQSAAGLARSLRVLGLGSMPDYRTTLLRARVRVTLMTGALDAKFSTLARDLAARGHGLTHREIPDVGHNLPLEAPVAVASVLAGALFP